METRYEHADNKSSASEATGAVRATKNPCFGPWKVRRDQKLLDKHKTMVDTASQESGRSNYCQYLR